MIAYLGSIFKPRTALPPVSAYNIDYLVVAGGGGGGHITGIPPYASGGAGGYRSGTLSLQTVSEYYVIIGSGGGAGTITFGNNSYFSTLNNTIISIGGGGFSINKTLNRLNGGSGAGYYQSPAGLGIAGQGNNGGIGITANTGGGGGAGQTGFNLAKISNTVDPAWSGNPSLTLTMVSTTGWVQGNYVFGTGVVTGTTIASVDSSTQVTLSQNATVAASTVLEAGNPSKGGDGLAWFDGIFRAGGGGGKSVEAGGLGGQGGLGGGGKGQSWSGAGSMNGTQNTGGGGGAASSVGAGGNGGSGIIKFRYTGTPRATGGTITQDGGFTYHEFTSSGRLIFTS